MPLSSRQKSSLLSLVSEKNGVRFDEPMSRHTTLRVGGPVDALVSPATIGAAQNVRRFCTDEQLPFRALGAGSNLLVLDGGIRGVMVATHRLRALRFCPALDGKTPVYVESGISTGKLLEEASGRNLGGVEFLGGVPGTVGGGLVMNAGTYLGEFKDITILVESIDQQGQLLSRRTPECGFVYRGSALPVDELIVAAHFHLPTRAQSDIKANVFTLRERRKTREPRGVGCAGSFFKNPTGDFAGRMIEACGLKGTRRGDAEISPAHANWLVNRGQARSSDFLELIDLIRASVQVRFGVQLQLEVKILGET